MYVHNVSVQFVNVLRGSLLIGHYTVMCAAQKHAFTGICIITCPHVGHVKIAYAHITHTHARTHARTYTYIHAHNDGIGE